MDEKEIKKKFDEFCENDRAISPAIGAIRTLLLLIESTNCTTINQLGEELKEAIKVLEKIDGKPKLAVSSACAQFLRNATLNLVKMEFVDISGVKKRMLDEGGKFLKRCKDSKLKVAKLGTRFIFDDAKVLVHSDSSVVLETLKVAAEKLQFTVYVASSSIGDNYKKVLHQNANVEIITEGEIGCWMETIDLILVGAEAVVKNGGILNQVGTLSLAICAKEMNKPLYVLAESFKFSLLYPLNQSDIPKEFRFNKDVRIRIDYTSPKYLTLVVTDRGLLTPTAVCDELIEMYV